MSSKVLLFCLSFAMAVCHFEASATKETRSSPKELITNFMKINEKFNFLSDRLDKLESNSSTENIAIEVNELKTNIKQMMAKQDKFESILLELVETLNEQKMNKRNANDGVEIDMREQCNSMCESKVNTWSNETRNHFEGKLKKLDFCIDNSTFQNDLKASNACDPNPCLGGGQCELMTYQCTKCPYLMSGTHCENLNCNRANRCFQYQNTMYVVFEESGSWEYGYNRCLSEGLTLAMPKDKDTSEAVINQLKSMYQPAQGLHFWIGLKNNGTAIYRWTDGSLLGAYTGGKADFKGLTGERWGLMWLHGGAQQWWPRSLGEIGSNYGASHYSLCEKRIFIRF